jgi:hypothetical protein
MGVQEPGRQFRASASVWPGGLGWKDLGQWSLDRAIGIEVVTIDETRAGGLRCVHDAGHDGRQQLLPFAVVRADAVINSGGAARGFGGTLGVGHITGYHLDTTRCVGPS